MHLAAIPLLQHLYDALHEPVGIVISADDGDAERLRQRLYALRKQSADKSLDDLAFIISPTVPGELWLVRKHPDAEEK